MLATSLVYCWRSVLALFNSATWSCHGMSFQQPTKNAKTGMTMSLQPRQWYVKPLRSLVLPLEPSSLEHLQVLVDGIVSCWLISHSWSVFFLRSQMTTSFYVLEKLCKDWQVDPSSSFVQNTFLKLHQFKWKDRLVRWLRFVSHSDSSLFSLLASDKGMSVRRTSTRLQSNITGTLCLPFPSSFPCFRSYFWSLCSLMILQHSWNKKVTQINWINWCERYTSQRRLLNNALMTLLLTLKKVHRNWVIKTFALVQSSEELHSLVAHFAFSNKQLVSMQYSSIQTWCSMVSAWRLVSLHLCWESLTLCQPVADSYSSSTLEEDH